MNFPHLEEIYSPQKMSLLGLCKSIAFGNLYGDKIDEYSKLLFGKIQTYINEVKRYIPQIHHAAFDSFLHDNIQWFCRICIQEGDGEFLNSSDTHIDEKRKRKVNNQLLHGIIRKKIGFLFKEKYGVFGDYINCCNFKNGTLRFSFFQEKYKGIITKFAYRYHKTFNLDLEDMKQELEIVLWKCISKYRGEDFARFSTYLRKALKNKMRDMYRAKFADKRIIDLYTISYQEGEGASYIGSLVDGVTAASWEILNREYESLSGEESTELQRGLSNSHDIESVFPRNNSQEKNTRRKKSRTSEKSSTSIDMNSPPEEILF